MENSNSTRTAIPKTETSMSEKKKKPDSLRAETPQPKRSTGIKDVIDIIWAALIFVLMIVVRFLHSAFEILSDIFVKVYRILIFCYRKPNHAKELFKSTLNIIKVSYDAEIWTWTDMWEIFKSHLVTPMTKQPPARPAPQSAKQK
ncbi:Protein RER1 [Caenorhabditis elegans]|uniref:Protein RER1 n=1 Tax=Caenorhabditis elegans TaxID=6239 RepID=Q9XVL0_CAEEL|nr:Protein RER1 [Caenorhabditis elegans]CAB03198.2 Protein RER1 [Caenorhabditis elegans]|eukprot:NP_505476.2 Uncharacterized protein CELE_K09G1.2 [Caenorhabditis elegans]